VRHWVPGRRFLPDEQVYILPSSAYRHEDEVACEAQEECASGPGGGNTATPIPGRLHPSASAAHAHQTKPPLLWKGGRLGGNARIRAWKRCGKQSGQRGWFSGQHILRSVPWVVEDEDASILLLQEDGSTGLDLSFATHIFLLDQLRDPALENQIISRAHRMGATGPVNVVLLLANELGWKGDDNAGSSSSSSAGTKAQAKDVRRRSDQYARGGGAGKQRD
jgi:hypothetical protein